MNFHSQKRETFKYNQLNTIFKRCYYQKNLQRCKKRGIVADVEPILRMRMNTLVAVQKTARMKAVKMKASE